jgi:PleD family two-component response regulator
MEQRVISNDPEALVAEVSRLRAEITRLESRVEELDRLANMDSLVPVANRRGLITQLDMMIARYERHGTPAALLFVACRRRRRAHPPDRDDGRQRPADRPRRPDRRR